MYVYGEEYFSQRNVYECTKNDVASTSLSRKDSS